MYHFIPKGSPCGIPDSGTHTTRRASILGSDSPTNNSQSSKREQLEGMRLKTE